nr:putative retrovirus-related Pol polyprotein from transposon TNT 1-94 [Tanacetum cinerariifolium]
MVKVPSDGINAAIDGKGNTNLWHQRLGHMSEKGMKILASKAPATMLPLSMTAAEMYGFIFLNLNMREFIEYCAENGIMMLKTVPKTPQQNGVAKRMNQTLNERAKKEWQGKEVSLAHLKVFGCDSYVKVPSDGINAAINGKGNTNLWHQRLGHMSEKGMKILVSKGKIPNLLKAVVGFCEPCVLGKQKEGTSCYYVTFIDDSSRNVWVYFLKLKYEGVDYNEIFSQVMKMTTIRLFLSIVASEDLHLEQLDFKTTFLHGDLDEDIYMTQPEGSQLFRKEENLMRKLKKSLLVRPLLYVDDMLVAGSDMADIKKLKRQLSQEFEMKDSGSAKHILGMSIIIDKTKAFGDHLKLSKKQEPKMVASRRRMAKSAIYLAKNPVYHGRTKHIKIRYHYIRELVSEGTLSLKKILGAKNPTDMLTNVVTIEKLKLCAASTGL